MEGGYIPVDWKVSFHADYLEQIKASWLIMTERYIENHFDEILSHACDIERRVDDSCCTKEWLIEENRYQFEQCLRFGCKYILIDKNTRLESYYVLCNIL